MKMLFFLISLQLINGCSVFSPRSWGENEMVIIPRGYRGVVFIVFEQLDGEPQLYRNGSRLYQIPQQGVLKTQFDRNEGLQSIPTFYYQQGNELFEVPFEIRPLEYSSESVYVCCLSIGFATGGETEKRVHYIRFFVGTSQEIEQAMSAASSKSIVDLVK